MTRLPIPAIALAALLAPGAALVPANLGAQPSFDCNAARSATEQAICASSSLSDLEFRMADVYRDLVAQVGRDEARRIADIQLERREACGADTACIERQLLTTIGIFRAETRAAMPQAATAPRADDEGSAALSDLRTALGREAEAAEQTDDRPDRPDRAERRAGMQAAFEGLSEYRRRMVQGRLRDAGFLSGPIDGIWGEASASGFESFFQAAGQRGIFFAVHRPEGARSALRFVSSDLYYYDFLPEAAR